MRNLRRKTATRSGTPQGLSLDELVYTEISREIGGRLIPLKKHAGSLGLGENQKLGGGAALGRATTCSSRV